MPLDVSHDEDRSRVRQRNAALVLSLFRRLVVSVAQTAITQVQTHQTRLGPCAATSKALPGATAARNGWPR